MEMEARKKKAAYDMQYAKEHIKRVPLDMKKEDYETLKAAADRAGEKVNAYIKKAIAQRMEREQEAPPMAGDSFGFSEPDEK